MQGIAFKLDEKEGRRLEILEDFTKFGFGLNKKFTISFEPLYQINSQGVKKFEDLYAVYRGDSKIGVVSASYTPISLSNELEFLLDILKDYEEIEKIDLKDGGDVININIILKNQEKKLNITPYEYLTKNSLIVNKLMLADKEILKKGLTLINSYIGRVANSLYNLLQRLICSNGAIDKSLGFKIYHRFKRENIENKLLKILKAKTQLDKLLEQPNIENKLMKPLSDKEIQEELIWLRHKIKAYNVSEKEYALALQELNLIQDVRDGKVPIWDMFNLYTAMATYRFEKKWYVKNNLYKKALELLVNSISLN
jgi:hypothetical protein